MLLDHFISQDLEGNIGAKYTGGGEQIKTTKKKLSKSRIFLSNLLFI